MEFVGDAYVGVGHARIQTTLDTYTRICGGQAERVEQLREVIAPMRTAA